jgi:plasmid stability protein
MLSPLPFGYLFMPAISVRDIPAPLYESLKVSAAANHRSLAKEVIVALTAHVSTNKNSAQSTPAERAAAIARILAAAPTINKSSKAYLKSEEEILGFGSKGI